MLVIHAKKTALSDGVDHYAIVFQVDAEHRRREGGVIQWIENGLRLCLYMCMCMLQAK